MTPTSDHESEVLHIQLADLHALLDHLLFRLQNHAGLFGDALRADLPQQSKDQEALPDAMTSCTDTRSDAGERRFPPPRRKSRTIHELMLDLHCLNTKLSGFLEELEEQVGVGRSSDRDDQGF